MRKLLCQTHPHLRTEFVYALDKNGDVDDSKHFDNLNTGSRSYALWKCPLTNCEKKCPHFYQSKITNRTRGQRPNGCPYCAYRGCKLVCCCNSLAGKRPDLLLEWDFANNTLNPQELPINSDEKVHWICKHTQCGHHKWVASVSARVAHDTKCPFCSGKRVCACLNFATQFPNILEEWDDQKNANVVPQLLTPCSTTVVWWKCKRCQHSWKTPICARTSNGKGCPKCKMSKMEKKMFSLLETLLQQGIFKSFRPQEEYIGTAMHADFVIICSNDMLVMLEMDGEQHFRPVSFGSNKHTPEELFKATQRRDAAKKEWCMQHEVHLLRIAYNVNEKDYETELLEFIAEIKERGPKKTSFKLIIKPN